MDHPSKQQRNIVQLCTTQRVSVSNNPKIPTCYYIFAMITLSRKYRICRMLFAGCSFVVEIFCPHLWHQLGWQLCCQQLEKGLAPEGCVCVCKIIAQGEIQRFQLWVKYKMQKHILTSTEYFKKHLQIDLRQSALRSGSLQPSRLAASLPYLNS